MERWECSPSIYVIARSERSERRGNPLMHGKERPRPLTRGELKAHRLRSPEKHPPRRREEREGEKLAQLACHCEA
jgi:hypothetical protein